MIFTSYENFLYNCIPECLWLEHFEFAEMDAVLDAQEVADQKEDEED